MRTGRNDPCPCNSGKKYKKCCLIKTDETKLAEAFIYSTQSMERNARIKQCLHQEKDKCDGKISKAHAIQNNKILNKVAENGHLITTDGNSNIIFQDIRERGRKIATTFSGFCNYHDKVLFQKIEDCEFIGTQEQVFFLTYRTMAWHYHKKQEQLKANSILKERMDAHGFDMLLLENFSVLENGLELDMEDNINEKLIFDDLLINNDFDKVNFSIWELPYEAEFAISMKYGLEYDIHGNRINNLKIDSNIENIYLNIFPENSKAYCIWSWLKENDDKYLEFSNQFMKLNEIYKENYLNNKLPRWSDSLIISPRLWKKWGTDIQDSFVTHMNIDFLYSMYEEESSNYEYVFMDTPWNLLKSYNK